MKKPDLHKFEDDLKNRPPDGSNAPPRTIRAKNLDENNVKLTLIENPNESSENKSYEVTYGKDGTYLSRILPKGSNKGDLLYWNSERWTVLAAPDSSTMHALTITSGTLAWTETEDC